MIKGKVDVDVDDMKALLLKARTNGAMEVWASAAIQWMEQAGAEVDRLRKIIEESGHE